MEQNAEVKESGSGYFRLIIQQGASQIALRRFSDWDAVGRAAAAAAAGSNVRKDIEFYDYIANITEKTLFDGMIMVTIILNALFMALETDYDLKYKLFGFFEIADEFFMAIYTMEFLMKVYVNPGVYWKNGYNVFDAIILVISFVPMFANGGDSSAMGTMRIVRAFRSLRVLKTVSFIRGLQALVVALFKTMKSVVYVLGLMFLLMFIFAIIGYYYFGDPNTGDPENWGDLGCALFTLFSLVTVDGWTDLQQNLDDLGMDSSRIFTIVFILIGYFIFFNMFIGVVIMEIQTGNFTKLVEQFNKSLRHTDYTVMEDLCTSMSFIDIYLTTLDHQDNTVDKLQQLLSEAILILSVLLEEDLIEMEQKAMRERKIKMSEQQVQEQGSI
ncbi:cation channel sperm-associated protein 3 isoform X2 [Coregonus clupeaformis]|uniref:cation channel sperm-associated protein 3 isoform X2 n=1 Tax=Coregonus clupeaformis TaxID=59861 RepID=UPI001BDFC08B|nr:cation channel sperm-associated protein 3 isoform X2 [Coregonus clupeaformis]